MTRTIARMQRDARDRDDDIVDAVLRALDDELAHPLDVHARRRIETRMRSEYGGKRVYVQRRDAVGFRVERDERRR